MTSSIRAPVGTLETRPVVIRELADELSRQVHQALSQGTTDQRAIAVYEDMLRHVKGVQRAVQRLADN